MNQPRIGRINRRQLLVGATALGLSAGAAPSLASLVGAQQASPIASAIASPFASPVAFGHALTSMTRAEFHQAIRQRFPLERPVREGGLVIYGQTSDISVLNPMLVSDPLSARITSLVFDALVSVSPFDGLSAPGLADFWQRSDDGLRYTFHLNQNATWHDGRPVTADDVVFTYHAFLAEGSPSGSKSTVATYLADVRKVDEHTVDLLAKDRSATFVEHTAGLVSILPRHIWESVPLTDWGRDPGTTGEDPRRVIGSGQFQFREWILNSHVTLDKRPDHWDPNLRPVIDTLMFRVLSASSAVLQAFEVGEIDIVDVETQEVAPLKQGRPDAEFTAFDTSNFGFFVTMQDPERTELFVDVPVRQALMYALDRQLLIDTVFDGYAVPATGTQPVPSIAYRPDQITTKYVHDPARARQLLEKAGWIVGNDGIRQRNGVRFSFECFFADSFPLFAQILPYMQQAWREVGIEMIPAGLPFPSLTEVLESGTFAMALLGFAWGVEGSQGAMYRCDAVPPTGFNYMRYCNPRYDELDDAQAGELNQAKRIELLVEASNIVNDDAATGVLHFRKQIIASQPQLHNFLPNGYSTLWSLPFVWVDDER